VSASEIITRRRKWSASDKAALLAEVEAEGGKVAIVARRHGISESVLYNWRSIRKAASVATGEPEGVDFVPVGVFAGASSAGPVLLASPEPNRTPPSRPSREGAGGIEIALPNGARICVDAFVNETAVRFKTLEIE
jgi:transposase